MKRLALYPDGAPLAAIERQEPVDLDHNCTACALHQGVKTVCMSADGEPGGILIVSDYPGNQEDALGRPMVGAAGRIMRDAVKKYGGGLPVIYDSALKCAPGATKIQPKFIDACRGYSAAILRDANPQRVIAAGSVAIQTVLGRGIPTFGVRRAYGWLGGTSTPVMTVMNPAAAYRNRFVQKWFYDDMKWALQTSVASLRQLTAWEGDAHFIETRKDAEYAAEQLRKHEWIVFDCETAGNMFAGFELLTISFCGVGADDAFVLDRETLRNKKVIRPFVRLLEDAAVPKVAQYGKFDIQAVFLALGIDVQGYFLDTGLFRHIVDPEAQTRLEYLQELVGMGGGKEEAQRALDAAVKICRQRKEPSDQDLTDAFGAENVRWARAVREADSRRVKTYAFALIDQKVRDRYCAVDSVSTARVSQQTEKEFTTNKRAARVWNELTLPAQEAFIQVHRWGMSVNRQSLETLDTYLMMRLKSLRDRFDRDYGETFSPGSPAQVAKLLFKKLRLPVLEHTKGGAPSTAKDVLEQIEGSDNSGTVRDILEFKRLQKLAGTYASSMVGHIRDDNRVHPNYKLDGTRTGRPSCEEPNLFNIPRAETLEGKMCRDVFDTDASENFLLSLDYSQMELRVLAGLSGDPKMRAIFESGDDYHMRTAQMVSKKMWGIEPEDCGKKERSAAKNINFGVVYGMGDRALAATIGCSAEEAAALRKAIFGEFKVADRWCRAKVKEARQTGEVFTEWPLGTPFGVRPLYRVADADDASRVRAEHGAVNSPVQGTAAFFAIASIIEAVKWAQAKNAERGLVVVRVVCSVYDSIMLEVHKYLLVEAYWKMKEIMTSWPCNGVPVVMDSDIGKSWGSLSTIKEQGSDLVVVQKIDDKDVIEAIEIYTDRLSRVS